MHALRSLVLAMSIGHGRRDVPVRFASALRSHINMSSCFRASWREVDKTMVQRVVRSHFGILTKADQMCELYSIEGFPVAAMLYTANNTHGMPIVDSFHLKKGSILIFNASAGMRSDLKKRYNRLTLDNAQNVKEFLACP